MVDEDREKLAGLIAAGLRWLGVEQHPKGVLAQHGIYCANWRNEFVMRLAPGSGAQFDPGSVLMFSRDPPFVDGEANLFTKELIGEIDRAIKRTATIVSRWNGVGLTEYSVITDAPTAESLQRAVRRYLEGCLEHPRKGLFCDCGWYRRGRELLAEPAEWKRADPSERGAD